MPLLVVLDYLQPHKQSTNAKHLDLLEQLGLDERMIASPDRVWRTKILGIVCVLCRLHFPLRRRVHSSKTTPVLYGMRKKTEQIMTNDSGVPNFLRSLILRHLAVWELGNYLFWLF